MESKRHYIACFIIHGAEYRSLNTKWPFLSCLLRWFNGFCNGFQLSARGDLVLGLCVHINQIQCTMLICTLPYQRKLVTREWNFLGQF